MFLQKLMSKHSNQERILKSLITYLELLGVKDQRQKHMSAETYRTHCEAWQWRANEWELE